MVDFATHQPSAGNEVLVDTRPTGPTSLLRCQAASDCLTPCLPPAGTLAGYIQPEDGEYSLLDR